LNYLVKLGVQPPETGIQLLTKTHIPFSKKGEVRARVEDHILDILDTIKRGRIGVG